MNGTSSVVRLRRPDEIDDPLTSVLRSGARQRLIQAVECKAAAYLVTMRGLKLPDGRALSGTVMLPSAGSARSG